MVFNLKKEIQDYLQLTDDTATALYKTAQMHRLHMAFCATKRRFNDDNLDYRVPAAYKEPEIENPTIKQRRDYFKSYYKKLNKQA